jgi:D-cysteine desulfhydrase
MLRNQGLNPYIVPIGGSNVIGCKGYIDAIKELINQQEELNIIFDFIFFASCSGGTHAGLALGKSIYNLKSKIVGINIAKDINPDNKLIDQIKRIVQDYPGFDHQKKSKTSDEIILIDGYNDSGYGTITKNEIESIKFLAKTEGILLDPVYTSRAFYGMMDMLNREEIPVNSNVLFWHTGGVTANFGYAEELL